MGKKKNPLPFDRAGGVITLQRRLIESDVYLRLSPPAKVLMTLLQVHWANDKPIGYGIREAADKIPCSRRTAMSAFKELTEAGFITMVNESLFNSRTTSKTRTWKLNWLLYKYKQATNEWKSN
ncbi:MAG: hypothetical protein RQ899_08700 [Pseudomonadales bacterium]|nr:hypothetical protein [Pseudomonadales bacterium]